MLSFAFSCDPRVFGLIVCILLSADGAGNQAFIQAGLKFKRLLHLLVLAAMWEAYSLASAIDAALVDAVQDGL